MAAAEPRSLVIGIDANAAAMAESSRRAWRGRGERRVPNAWFMVEAAERSPGPLAGVASLVTVTMPWGSLLRGVVGLDRTALRGTASLVAPGGRVEILASVNPSDAVAGLFRLDGRRGARHREGLGGRGVRARLDAPGDGRRPPAREVLVGAPARGSAGLANRACARESGGATRCHDRSAGSFGLIETTADSIRRNHRRGRLRAPRHRRLRVPAHPAARWATLSPDSTTPAPRPGAGRQRRTCERGQGDDAPAR